MSKLRIGSRWHWVERNSNQVEFFGHPTCLSFVLNCSLPSPIIINFLDGLKCANFSFDEFCDAGLKYGISVEQSYSLYDEFWVRGFFVLISDGAFLENHSEFSRQIAFFEAFEHHSTDARSLNDEIQQSVIGLIGLGGYGSWIFQILARVGVGRILCVDDDVVERSNLPRQSLYGTKDIGRKKVTAAIEAAATFSHTLVDALDMRIRHSSEVQRVFKDCDLVICPFGYILGDTFNKSTLSIVNEGCVRSQIPLLAMGAGGMGPLVLPGSPCCNCLARDESFYQIIQNTTARLRNPFQGAYAPRLAISAGLVAWEMTLFLARLAVPKTLGHIVAWDFVGYEYLHLPIKQSETCYCQLSR